MMDHMADTRERFESARCDFLMSRPDCDGVSTIASSAPANIDTGSRICPLQIQRQVRIAGRDDGPKVLRRQLITIASHPAVASADQSFGELLSPFRGLNAARRQRGMLAQYRATGGDYYMSCCRRMNSTCCGSGGRCGCLFTTGTCQWRTGGCFLGRKRGASR